MACQTHTAVRTLEHTAIRLGIEDARGGAIDGEGNDIATLWGDLRPRRVCSVLIAVQSYVNQGKCKEHDGPEA